jgi:hypothetical protein
MNCNVEHNHKLRTVIDLLLNHGKIKQVNAKPMVLQYIDSELSSDPSDISDTTVKADQNKVISFASDSSDISDTPVKTGPNMVASFTSDISDISHISDSPLSNIKMLADVKTDEQNHHDASDTSDLSDHYSISTNSIVLSSDHAGDGENQIQSNITDVSNTTRNRQDDLQKSAKIFRLGRSDTWACENCKQKGDVHYMREHLCRR